MASPVLSDSLRFRSVGAGRAAAEEQTAGPARPGAAGDGPPHVHVRFHTAAESLLDSFHAVEYLAGIQDLAACGRKMMPILCSQMWPGRFRVMTHIQHPNILTFYDLRPRTTPADRSL
jgi:hypothetical protein